MVSEISAQTPIKIFVQQYAHQRAAKTCALESSRGTGLTDSRDHLNFSPTERERI